MWRIGLSLMTGLLTGCLEQKIHHPVDTYTLLECPPEQACSTGSIELPEPGKPYALGFIEIDDQGVFWDREQLEQLKGYAQSLTRAQNTLIYVYVHGWQHNADGQDSNVVQFRHHLANLSQQLPEQDWSVLGVYIGWRGRSVAWPLLEHTTFWDRQSAAKRVADGSITEVFSYLNTLKKQSITETRVITLGHSFGGAIVFSAINKLLAQELVDSSSISDFDASTKGLGDLTILINPAFDALKYAHFHDLQDRYNQFYGGQKPILALFTSESDWATRYAFPLGNAVTRSFEAKRYMRTQIGQKTVLVNQSSAGRIAIGHFAPYRTHRLTPVDVERQPQMTRLQSARYSMKQWEQGLPNIHFRGADLKRRAELPARMPYLVVSVDEALIPNHNDFSGPAFQSFLQDFVTMSIID
ncbi:hypothetical protein [Vibrio europaeus]|uniref:hypothetical protein n=1 Tax=Vibrio europaeus TaxID=300876 RepID=UPI00233F355A|nr:hypothetical protein [Vibrio europaeus]MDC5813437.1 hypothetical protein [Vibrio europaeus]